MTLIDERVSPQLPDLSDTSIAFAPKSYLDLKHAYTLFNALSKPGLVEFGTAFTELALKFHLPIRPFVKPLIYKQFCAGETFAESVRVFDKLAEFEVGSMVNYGIEAKENEDDFETALTENLRTIDYAETHDNVNIIATKVTAFGAFSLFEKKQSGKAFSDSEQQAWDRMLSRVDRLAKRASDKGVHLYLDAEESWIQDALDEVVNGLMRSYNRKSAVVFNTYQLYRHDKLAELERMLDTAASEGWIIGAKLVRGAYVDKENHWAEEHGTRSFVHPNKELVDIDFNKSIDLVLSRIDRVSFCVASHNEESNMHLAREVERLGIDRKHPHIVCSQLYGMGDHITYNMAKAGFNAVKYIPYGPVREVVPYLIRRAKENMSIEGQMSRELQLLQRELKRRRLRE